MVSLVLLTVGGTLPSLSFFSFGQGSEGGESVYEEKVTKSEKEWHFACWSSSL